LIFALPVVEPFANGCQDRIKQGKSVHHATAAEAAKGRDPLLWVFPGGQ
jgi:hypothetical protein